MKGKKGEGKKQLKGVAVVGWSSHWVITWEVCSLNLIINDFLLLSFFRFPPTTTSFFKGADREDNLKRLHGLEPAHVGHKVHDKEGDAWSGSRRLVCSRKRNNHCKFKNCYL